jgi:hypothetical protein
MTTKPLITNQKTAAMTTGLIFAARRNRPSLAV